MREWEEAYHAKQFSKVYRSTEVFTEWLENKGFLSGENKVLDMACGAGSNALYMANRHESLQVVGMDISKEFVDYGNKMIEQQSKYKNCELCVGNWFDIESKWINVFDGIISFQTLFMLPDYKEALGKLIDLHPNWIAVSSLFYEGDIEYTNTFRDYYRATNGKEYTDYYYNIHSMIRYKKYMEENGYNNLAYMPFEIDIDLPKPDSMDIGTYTIETIERKRIQISGGLMMPWYFVVAYK